MMAATADVLLRIGTQLSGSGLKDLQAAQQMILGLANRAIDLAAGLDRANEALEGSRIKIGEAIASSKGLLSAVQLVTNGNKIWESGIKATATELAVLAKKAVIFGDAVGISETEAMDKLTEALVRGSARGLKPFGLELDASLPRAEAFSAAVKKMAAEMAGTEVQLATASDKFTSYSNGLKNVATVAWGAMTSFFTGLATGSGDGAASFSQFTAVLIDDLERIKIVAGALGGWWNDLFANIRDGMGLFAGAADATRKAGFDIASRDPAIIAARAAVADAVARADAAEDYSLSVELGENTAPQSVAEAAVGNLDSVSAVGTTQKRRGGGGGRAKRARDTRTVDEMFAPMMRDEITDEDLLGGMRGATMSGADQAAIDMQAEWAAAVGDGNDELANRTAALTLEISMAEEWASAWENAYGRVNPLQFMANSLVTSYTNVVGAGIRAAVTYGASVKQAMLEALAATASTMAVEAGLNAIKALATGLYLTATRQYDAAASSFASAAQWGALAALAGSVSYAAGASASSGKKSSGAQVSGGGYETPLTGGRQAREEDRVTNITLNLDGEVIYNSVANHDRSRSVSGQSRIGAY